MLIKLLNILIILLTIFYCNNLFAAKNANGQDSIKELIKKQVTEIMNIIHNKDTDKIGKYIPDEGIYEGDTYTSKESYLKELLDEKSFSYASLYGLPDRSAFNKCKKEGGVLNVSPFFYIKTFGSEFNMKVVNNLNNVYYGVKIEQKSVENCVVDLLPINYQIIDGKLYIDGFLFQ